MSDTHLKNLFMGNTSPIYWRDIMNHAENIKDKLKVANFPRYVLKCLFVKMGEPDVCLHYKPKKINNRRGKDPNAEYTKDEYKGPPNTDKAKWVMTARIIKVEKASIIVQDRTKKVKQTVRRDDGTPVEKMLHPIKRILIDRIDDITNKDNSRIDFSKYLRGSDFEKVNRKTYKKNMSLKNQFKKDVSALEKKAANELTNDPHKNYLPEKTPMQNLLEVHDDTKKRLVDYWSYLDAGYAKAIVKDY